VTAVAGLIITRSAGASAARLALDDAVTESQRLGCATCVAVTDPAGELLAFVRMDGAPRLGVRLAQDKAYSAAIHGIPTHEWWDLLSGDPSLVHGIRVVDRLVIFGGGVPVIVDGELVAAVGVSGRSSPDQDRQIAEVAARAIVAAP
jgi:glc operon protein GlcG